MAPNKVSRHDFFILSYHLSGLQAIEAFLSEINSCGLGTYFSVVEGARQVYYTLCRSTPTTLIHCSPRGGKQVYKGRAPYESSVFDSLFTVRLGRKIHSKHVSWKAVLKTLGRLRLVEKERESEKKKKKSRGKCSVGKRLWALCEYLLLKLITDYQCVTGDDLNGPATTGRWHWRPCAFCLIVVGYGLQV